MYEESVDSEDATFAHKVDKRCVECPVQRICLTYASTHKEWGVWGGIYFEDGKFSTKYNKHKDPSDWSDVLAGAITD